MRRAFARSCQGRRAPRYQAVESNNDSGWLSVLCRRFRDIPPQGGYRTLNTFNEAIPPAIDELVRQCLLREAAGRPQSAAAFLALLNQALAPHQNFTETLSKGSLYEIESAIANMLPSDFARLPKG